MLCIQYCTMACTHSSCTTLLDLPDELLCSCLARCRHIPYDHLNNLGPCMSACKKLLRVMLRGSRSGTLGLQLQIRRIEDIPVRKATLQFITKAFPDLHKLHIELSLNVDLAACLAAFDCNEEPGARCLKGITHLCLRPYQGASISLPHPVPFSVAVAFPHLKKLKLHGIELIGSALTGQPAQPARLEHLQQLQLYNCSLPDSAAAFQQQLQLLPSLQVLSLVECMCGWMAGKAAVQEEYAEAVSDSCSDKLMHMEWSSWCWWVETSVAVKLLSRPYAQLQALVIPDTKVDDSIMDLLLQHAPSIRKLHVGGFQLKQDFSHRQCSWEMVVIHRHMYVASFAHMPLSHKPRLLVSEHPLSLFVYVPSTRGDVADILQQITSAAAAVERCGGIRMVDGEPPVQVIIEMGNDRVQGNEQVFLAALPMLRNIIGHLPLYDLHVTRALLQGISAELPHCCKIRITKGCTFEDGIWGVMVSLLPHVTDIEVSVEAATLHQLGVFCAMATHSISLTLQDCEPPNYYDDEEDEHEWLVVLEQAVMDAGHNHVAVCIEYKS